MSDASDEQERRKADVAFTGPNRRFTDRVPRVSEPHAHEPHEPRDPVCAAVDVVYDNHAAQPRRHTPDTDVYVHQTMTHHFKVVAQPTSYHQDMPRSSRAPKYGVLYDLFVQAMPSDPRKTYLPSALITTLWFKNDDIAGHAQDANGITDQMLVAVLLHRVENVLSKYNDVGDLADCHAALYIMLKNLMTAYDHSYCVIDQYNNPTPAVAPMNPDPSESGAREHDTREHDTRG